MKKNDDKNKALKSYSIIRSYAVLPFNKITRPHFFAFISNIYKNFFIIQQKQKLGITKIPVVNVEHVLDEKIPFLPNKVNIYLDFVGFFTRILSMLLKKFPKEEGCSYSASLLDFIARLYKNAGSVYSNILTTTNRPNYKKDINFIIIHTFDPHLLCVPSLHVAIVAGCWAFLRKIFLTSCFLLSNKEKQDILNEVYSESVSIIESVLYIKQHSINCVAAAFYMLSTSEENGFFSVEDADCFINDLFLTQTDIDDSTKKEIHLYIYDIYKKMAVAKESCESWQQPILDFIEKYHK